jgi:hypothetical protein
VFSQPCTMSTEEVNDIAVIFQEGPLHITGGIYKKSQGQSPKCIWEYGRTCI